MAFKKQNRRTLFAKLYAQGLSQEDAALGAGYSQSTARKSAYRLLQDPEVKQIVKDEQESIVREGRLSRQWFLEKCMKVMEASAETYEYVDKNGKNKKRCIDAGAAAMMARTLKDALPDFTEKHEHSIAEKQKFKIGGFEIEF